MSDREFHFLIPRDPLPKIELADKLNTKFWRDDHRGHVVIARSESARDGAMLDHLAWLMTERVQQLEAAESR